MSDEQPTADNASKVYEPIWDPNGAGVVEVGIDITEIDRVRDILAYHGERFLRRCFTPREAARYGTRPQELAARFAAKEATMKVLGTGVYGIRWKDIETLPNAWGKPILVLHGTALRRANKLGFQHLSVSLTHARDDAMATVIAWKPVSSPPGSPPAHVVNAPGDYIPRPRAGEVTDSEPQS